MHKNALKVKNQIAWEDGFTFTYSDKEQNNNGLTDATLIFPSNRIPTLLKNTKILLCSLANVYTYVYELQYYIQV